jgi:hypothetical protein
MSHPAFQAILTDDRHIGNLPKECPGLTRISDQKANHRERSGMPTNRDFAPLPNPQDELAPDRCNFSSSRA